LRKLAQDAAEQAKVSGSVLSELWKMDRLVVLKGQAIVDAKIKVSAV